MEIQTCGKTCEGFSICKVGKEILKHVTETEHPLCPFQSYDELLILKQDKEHQLQIINTLHDDLENMRDNAQNLEKIIDSMKAKLPWYRR